MKYKLTLYSRIISRKFLSFSLILKLSMFIVIATSFIYLMLSNNQRTEYTLGVKDSGNLDKTYLLEGIRLYELGELELAKENIEAALEENPSNRRAIDIYKRFLDADQQIIESEVVQIQNIISQRPDYATAWLKLSILYEQLGDQDKSLAAKNEAIKLNANLK